MADSDKNDDTFYIGPDLDFSLLISYWSYQSDINATLVIIVSKVKSPVEVNIPVESDFLPQWFPLEFPVFFVMLNSFK